jgi:hypothetical protein
MATVPGGSCGGPELPALRLAEADTPYRAARLGGIVRYGVRDVRGMEA